MDWSFFKFEFIKELNINLHGWFSNLRLFNKVDSPTIKTVNKITVNQLYIDRKNIPSILSSNDSMDMTLDNLQSLALPMPGSVGGVLSVDSTGEKQKINSRIDETVAMIKFRKFEDARERLLTILGEIKNKTGMHKELGRVYNNIGATYNIPDGGGDYDKACYYFRLAIESDPYLTKSKTNLSQTLFNKGDEKSVADGLLVIRALWEVEKNPDILQILLWGLYKEKGESEAVFNFIKENPDVRDLIDQSEGASNLLSLLYLEKRDFENSLKYIDYAMSISPDWPELLNTKAKALLIRAQEKYSINSEFDIVPKLSDYEDVNEALKLLTQAKDLAEHQDKKYLIPEILYGISTSLIWLGRYDESKYNLKLIPSNNFDETTSHSVDVLNFAVSMHDKDFELAYDILVKGEGYKHFLYAEKRRIARVFLLHGAVEQAERLLLSLQVESERLNDVSFWFDMSAVYVLLDKQQEAVVAASKSKKIAENQNDDVKKTAHSHYNAVMFHYSKFDDGENSETSRLVTGMAEFQKEFPEENILTSIKAQNEDGDLTDEVKKIFISAKERFENVKKVFKEKPIPFYYLEKIFHRTLADLITWREDPDFIIQFTGTNPEFLKENEENFSKSESYVFDYLSLLDLAKMGFLGFLEKMNKPIYVHELLFRKIQEELLQKEIKELRDLWNFLRKSKVIIIVSEKMQKDLKGRSADMFFDDWLIQSLKLSLTRNSTFVTNDLHIYSYSKSENISVINIMIILNKWRKDVLIDNKMYSRALGDLAERYYVFIPYNAEDLFEIVLEDKCKITHRSYHLVNQIFLAGSVAESFVGVFVKFIDLLWRTGALPGEKVAWVKFLSNTLLEIVDKEYNRIRLSKQGSFNLDEESKKIKPFISSFGLIWNSAIKNGNKDDLMELIKITNEVLNKDYLDQSKIAIRSKISEKIK